MKSFLQVKRSSLCSSPCQIRELHPFSPRGTFGKVAEGDFFKFQRRRYKEKRSGCTLCPILISSRTSHALCKTICTSTNHHANLRSISERTENESDKMCEADWTVEFGPFHFLSVQSRPRTCRRASGPLWQLDFFFSTLEDALEGPPPSS